MALSDDQKALRRQGLGSSDSPIILGLSQFKSPFDLWLSKVEGFEPESETWQELGDLLEPVALELYRRRTGASVTTGHGTYRHPRNPILLDTPDGIATSVEHGTVPLEAKAIRFRGEEWGEEGTDEVEPAYLAQAQHHMLVLREVLGLEISEVHLPVLFGGSEFAIYRVPWDPEFAGLIEEECSRWWRDHVVARKPPPLEGSRNASAWLRRRFPRDTAPILQATADDVELAMALRNAEQARDLCAESFDALKAQLQERIGTAAGIEGDGFRITWKANAKGSRTFRTNWQTNPRRAA